MPKKHRSRHHAQTGVINRLRHRTVTMYLVYAYKPGEPAPEPAHLQCGNKCGERYYIEAAPFGPLPACRRCGTALQHRNFVAAEKPLFFLNREEKHNWLDLGYVSSQMRGSVLRLKLLLPPKPQASMTTAGIADGVVSGKGYALAVLAAYGPRDRQGTIPRWDNYGEQAA